MKKQWNELTMNKAVTMFIKGEKLKDIVEQTTVAYGSLLKRLKELTCKHPLCTNDYPCRAAKRRYGGVLMCTALEDVDFRDEFCPFFKTEDDFKHEYRKSNRLKPDPYELYSREIDLDDEDWR